MKNFKSKKTQKRIRIKKKIRSQIFGTAAVPRLSVFRSNKHIYVQLIDDSKSVTLASASDAKIKAGAKSAKAEKVGALIAEAGKAKKISKVVFDRNGFRYTGRVKTLADAARAAGLKF
jgi:large subunit ribosomal protein L18